MRIAKKNPLLSDNKFPISLSERYKENPIFDFSLYGLTKSSLYYLSISNVLSFDLRYAISLKIKELSNCLSKLRLYATIIPDSKILAVKLNRLYWGGNIIKCEIENAVFFWLASITPLKEFLPRIITELLQTYSPRKIIYWLRYADVQTSEIAKLFPTSNKNIYRWVENFRISELKRLKNESICLHLKYISNLIDYNNFTKGKRVLKIKYNDNISASYTFKELTDIDNLKGEFKRHIRRTKAEIKADRKK